jgi:hypothetical protein
MGTWGEIKLGNNTIRNSTGVLEIDGKEVIGMDLGNDEKLLLYAQIYGADGAHLARLWKGKPAFGGDAFDVTRTRERITLVEKGSGRVVFDARLAQLGKPLIEVLRADLYGPGGSHVEVRADGSVVAGGVTLTGNTIDGFGSAIAIGRSGFTIGRST